MSFTRQSIYPWDKWTNGEAWRVEQNIDFYCFGMSFAGACYWRAHKLEMAVVTSVFEYEYDNDVVFFWFYDASSLWKPNFKAFPAWKKEQARHIRRVRS